METVKVRNFDLGKPGQLFLIAGPCVIESEESAFYTAKTILDIAERHSIPFIFKSSYDKANRSSITSFRGPGIDAGLEILANISKELNIPVTTDIHSPAEADLAAEVVDIIQIPAFLSRQTDILAAAAATGKTVNIKKGQFLAPEDMTNVVNKVKKSGAKRILLTERGSSFGYNNLVVDMRSIPIMQSTGCPVVFDATHSVQLPGGHGTSSGGDRRFVKPLACAAVAAGTNGLFFEVHAEPEKALCDPDSQVKPKFLDALLGSLIKIAETVNAETGTTD